MNFRATKIWRVPARRATRDFEILRALYSLLFKYVLLYYIILYHKNYYLGKNFKWLTVSSV